MRMPDYEIVPGETNQRQLVLRDPDTGLSITNGAEALVHKLHQDNILRSRRLIYYDTMGSRDELLHNGAGGFLGFACAPLEQEPAGDLIVEPDAIAGLDPGRLLSTALEDETLAAAEDGLDSAID